MAGYAVAMSDFCEEPKEDEVTYPDAREEQGDLEGLVEENDGDFQQAVDDHYEGEKPEGPRPNPGVH